MPQNGACAQVSERTDHGNALVAPDADRPPPRPRWLKLLLLGILVVVLGFVVMHLLQGKGPQLHGPGMNHGMSVGPAVTVESTPLPRGAA